MAKWISLIEKEDPRGRLTVIEKSLPFEVKRIATVEPTPDSKRGGYSFKSTDCAVVCLKGSCKAHLQSDSKRSEFTLDDSGKALFIESKQWRELYDFEPGTFLMFLYSKEYEKDELVFQRPSANRPQSREQHPQAEL